jgi:hypothetical protein
MGQHRYFSICSATLLEKKKLMPGALLRRLSFGQSSYAS